MPIVDRYTPSPTSGLHLGNLRTALAGWLLTRREEGRRLLHVGDLNTTRVRAAGGTADRQLSGLRRLGMIWDGETVTQSERLDVHRNSLTWLQGRTCECLYTRKEIERAISAPHGEGRHPYSGTRAWLSTIERAQCKQQHPAAIRIHARGARFTATDRFADGVTGVVGDFVLIRGDGVPTYNFAAVMGDLHQGMNRITQGTDPLDSAPRQAWLATLPGGRPPNYAYIGLITSPAGRCLTKHGGVVILADLLDRG